MNSVLSCTIEGCGLPAVGRCLTCSQTFYISHQGTQTQEVSRGTATAWTVVPSAHLTSPHPSLCKLCQVAAASQRSAGTEVARSAETAETVRLADEQRTEVNQLLPVVFDHPAATTRQWAFALDQVREQPKNPGYYKNWVLRINELEPAIVVGPVHVVRSGDYMFGISRRPKAKQTGLAAGWKKTVVDSALTFESYPLPDALLTDVCNRLWALCEEHHLKAPMKRMSTTSRVFSRDPKLDDDIRRTRRGQAFRLHGTHEWPGPL